MKLIVAQVLRSRWLAGVVHACLWLLVYFAATRLGGKLPAFQELDGSEPVPPVHAAIAKLDPLFTSGAWPKVVVGTNEVSVFYTLNFAPTPKPTPPPPTTRKIELTYQGFYNVEGKSRVLVKMDDRFLVTPLGSNVTANLFAANATALNLTLTNSTAQTNVLTLNLKKQLEVPIK